MKKLTLLFCLQIPIILFSQGVKFGIFVEPKISWLSPDVKNISNGGSRMGVNIGLVMDGYFTDNYAFATGISINNVGGKLEFTEAFELATSDTSFENIDPNTKVTYKLQYVNIPIGLKLKTNDIGNFAFTSNVGITPQINIKARVN
ncbi:MAG: PorT family protein, partial [Bacteroidales bacterium]|nr:PorT family protein [Bacteroidales bacterium]